MTEKVLLVDDEPNVLQGYKRSLHSQFDVKTALGGKAALKMISSQGPFAVVVSDMQMPEMDGIQFLIEVKAKAPETIRIMLTGNADQQVAMDAVNEGSIFRFLTKPCQSENLGRVLATGLEQYRLVTAERELLEKTLNGCINMLTEILSLYHPELFGRSTHIQELIRKISTALNLPSSWEMEAACMLSQIGYLGLPPEILLKTQESENLSEEEDGILALVPEIGGQLLANIPRLESVSKILLYQNKRFDGSGFPDDSVQGNQIPLGARVLKVLSDLAGIEATGIPRNQAIEQLQIREGWYDPLVLNKVTAIFWKEELDLKPQNTLISAMINDLKPGDVLKSDIKVSDGTILLKTGLRVSMVQLERIRNCTRIRKVVEPVQVERLGADYENSLF